jgi:hypothetical protein
MRYSYILLVYCGAFSVMGIPDDFPGGLNVENTIAGKECLAIRYRLFRAAGGNCRMSPDVRRPAAAWFARISVLDGKTGDLGFARQVFADRDQFFVEFDAVNNDSPEGIQFVHFLFILRRELYQIFVQGDFHGKILW